ncbi:MAG: hypothetical protein A4E19_14745 [Nitrospira sp. SG-bin1]|nr:MAG: hypothetical protein A4E19_14745 [Nitrospira sp. SG-bin1]
MIDRTFKPIVSIVGETATRLEKIDASSTMIGETYEPTVRRIRTGLLAQWDAITNSAISIDVRPGLSGPCFVI